MSNIRHHAIFVGGSEHKVAIAHRNAGKIFPADMVTPICFAPVATCQAFAIAPDGSKVGREDSELGEQRRDAFISHLEGSDLDWFEITYGESYGDSCVYIERASKSRSGYYSVTDDLAVFIVTSDSDDRIQDAHARIISCVRADQISEIGAAQVNGYRTFLVIVHQPKGIDKTFEDKVKAALSQDLCLDWVQVVWADEGKLVRHDHDPLGQRND